MSDYKFICLDNDIKHSQIRTVVSVAGTETNLETMVLLSERNNLFIIRSLRTHHNLNETVISSLSNIKTFCKIQQLILTITSVYVVIFLK